MRKKLENIQGNRKNLLYFPGALTDELIFRFVDSRYKYLLNFATLSDLQGSFFGSGGDDSAEERVRN